MGRLTVTTDVNRKNGARHVYPQLKQLVINYRIAPGRQLHPSDFVHSMKVSATPVRDAMHRLSGEQLLVFVPNKGFFSKVLDLVEMRELFELEFVLLQHALLTTETGLESAEEIGREAELDAENSAALCTTFERLFERIAALSGNMCLTKLLTNLLDRTHYVSVLDFEEESRRREAAKQLGGFVGNLAVGKVHAAVLILRRQLQEKMNRLPELVKEGLARSHRPCEPFLEVLATQRHNHQKAAENGRKSFGEPQSNLRS